MSCPIGVFDSGYGGLTILKDIVKEMPEYDYIYLGDNARTPYGTRSFDVVYKYTREAVVKLFGMGCKLVILACNTASAKALRTIQQVDCWGLSGPAWRRWLTSLRTGISVFWLHQERLLPSHICWRSLKYIQKKDLKSRSKPAPCGFHSLRITR